MAKEKKNVEALNDEKLEQASGGKAYWTDKPKVNTHPNPMLLTGRMRPVPGGNNPNIKFDLEEWKKRFKK